MPKKSKKINKGGANLSPLLTRPEKVAIVALGRSSADYMQQMIGNATRQDVNKPLFDEVWTVNRGILGFNHDKLFVMDDLKWLEEKKDKKYAAWLRQHNKPIITSTEYPDDYPQSVSYPLNSVMEHIEDDIFAVNTVSYMVAYAMYIGVKHLHIYGADFFYPGGSTAEEGGQAVAYLLGMCAAQKIMIHHIPQSSTLLYAFKVQADARGNMRRPPYGYHRKESMEEATKLDKQRKDQQQKGLQ